MKKDLFFDLPMGASGDMIVGALLDLVDNPEEIIEKLNEMGLPDTVIDFVKTIKDGIEGMEVNVEVMGEEEHSHDYHDHENYDHRERYQKREGYDHKERYDHHKDDHDHFSAYHREHHEGYDHGDHHCGGDKPHPHWDRERYSEGYDHSKGRRHRCCRSSEHSHREGYDREKRCAHRRPEHRAYPDFEVKRPRQEYRSEGDWEHRHASWDHKPHPDWDHKRRGCRPPMGHPMKKPCFGELFKDMPPVELHFHLHIGEVCCPPIEKKERPHKHHHGRKHGKRPGSRRRRRRNRRPRMSAFDATGSALYKKKK